MPFILTNAPTVSQAPVNNVFGDMLDQLMFVYLDEILIFSNSPEEQERAVLQRLLGNSHLSMQRNGSSTSLQCPF